MHPFLHARTSPEKLAYVTATSGERVTYRELDERSNQGAQLFRSWGLEADQSGPAGPAASRYRTGAVDALRALGAVSDGAALFIRRTDEVAVVREAAA